MSPTLTQFLRRNGFRFLLLGLLLLTASKKNLRFHIDMQAPGLTSGKDQAAHLSQGDNKAEARSRSSVLQWNGWRFWKRSPDRKSRRQAYSEPVWKLDPEAQDAFVRRFARVAIAERKRYGIPTSFILAHGLLQSQAGYDLRVTRGNNYFGIPCTPDWRGATIEVDGTCYRAYETAWMSFRDHSLFLTQGPYKLAKRPDSLDFAGWIESLKASGYPFPSGLPDAMQQLIEDIPLSVLDEQDQ